MALDDLLDPEELKDVDEEAAAPPEEAPVAPQYVTLDQFQQQMNILNNLATSVQGLAQGFNAQAGRKEPEPTIQDATEEELVEAGIDPKVARKLLNASAERLRREYKAEISDLRDVGLGAVAKLVHSSALGDNKHYQKYKGEVDAMVEQLDARAKLNPDVLKACLNQVVAVHVDEIVADDRKERARKTALDTKTGTPGGRTGRQVHTVRDEEEDDEYTEDAYEMLDRLGKNPDEMARSMGYDSHKDMMKKTKV